MDIILSHIMKKTFKFSKASPELKICDTGKYGSGVFANEDIKKGQIVYVFGGERIDVTDLLKRVNSNEENIDDPFQIGKRTYIDLDEISRSFNHSCDPSTGVRKTAEMFALRDIKKGEEITFDYSLTIAPTDWKMKCMCDSKICRKILGDILSVPKKRLEEYREAGALQNYMKLLLGSMKNGKYKIPEYEKLVLEKLKNTSNFK